MAGGARDISLKQASPEYKSDEEHQFRRELEAYLSTISALLDSIARGRDTQSSLNSKMASYQPPVGIVVT